MRPAALLYLIGDSHAFPAMTNQTVRGEKGLLS